MQAKLPEILESVTLLDLTDDAEVYTVPWAMYADKNGNLWLNGNYSFYSDLGGTVQMKVSKKDGKYICDVSLCKNHGWSRDGGGFFGEFTPLPVSELVGY